MFAKKIHTKNFQKDMAKKFMVDFWFGLIGLVFLPLTAILGVNSTYTKPRKLKFGMQVQLTKKKIIQGGFDLVEMGLT